MVKQVVPLGASGSSSGDQRRCPIALDVEAISASIKAHATWVAL
jgi:hypothetical protein